MGRLTCCEENVIKKGPWSPEEDQILVDYINEHGHESWKTLPKLAGLKRCGKSCRLRWTNYLRPGIKRGKFTKEDEQTIMHLHCLLGNKWSTIASFLPGRTDNEIKNFWNTRMRKKLIRMGLDPMTHQPRTDMFTSLNHVIALANFKTLVDQLPIEQQATKFQSALQFRNLQQLHEYLQSNTLDIQATNFWNSFPQNISTSQRFQNQGLISPIENANSQPFINDPILLDPQVAYNFQSLNYEQINPNLYPSASSISLPMSDSVTSISDVGDGGTTSNSTHGSGEIIPIDWSNLFFEEPSFYEYCLDM